MAFGPFKLAITDDLTQGLPNSSLESIKISAGPDYAGASFTIAPQFVDGGCILTTTEFAGLNSTTGYSTVDNFLNQFGTGGSQVIDASNAAQLGKYLPAFIYNAALAYGDLSKIDAAVENALTGGGGTTATPVSPGYPFQTWGAGNGSTSKADTSIVVTTTIPNSLTSGVGLTQKAGPGFTVSVTADGNGTLYIVKDNTGMEVGRIR